MAAMISSIVSLAYPAHVVIAGAVGAAWWALGLSLARSGVWMRRLVGGVYSQASVRDTEHQSCCKSGRPDCFEAKRSIVGYGECCGRLSSRGDMAQQQRVQVNGCPHLKDPAQYRALEILR
jgi:hypothetical protein